MVELLTVTPGLLVLLYHPVVRHVVEELLHFEIRQSRDFRKASREDDFLRALGDKPSPLSLLHPARELL